MATFNLITFEPSKTYATAENALKAVAKYAERFSNSNAHLFNVIMGTTPDGRFYPMLCNINKDYFQLVIHSGFNCVN